MPTIIEALDELAKKPWNPEWKTPAWKQYILKGDKALLKQLPKPSAYCYLPGELLQVLASPLSLDPATRRLLEAFAAAKFEDALGQWLGRTLSGPKEEFEAARKVLLEVGCSASLVAGLAGKLIASCTPEEVLASPASRFLSSLPAQGLLEVLDYLTKKNDDVNVACGVLLAAQAPVALEGALKQRLSQGNVKGLGAEFWEALLARDYPRFSPLAAQAFESAHDSWQGFEIGQKLAQHDFARFGASVEQRAVKYLQAKGQEWHARDAGLWLATWAPRSSFAALKSYFAGSPRSKTPNAFDDKYCKLEVLECAAEKLGAEAVPLFEACFQNGVPELQASALQHWMKLKETTDTQKIIECFRTVLAGGDSGILTKVVRSAADWNLAAVEAELWALLSHKSRPVREVAAAVLAKFGDARLPKAQELWAVRRADTRLAAVSWLKAVGTPAAAAELKARLEVEEDDDVRDALLLALEKLAGSQGQIDSAELQRRIDKTLEKLSGPPVKWLDPMKLPMPKLKDGRKLDSDILLYLLYRQSRVKEMRADIEAKPLYAQLDRATSGNLALAVLEAFFGSKMDADDRWTMAFAALVGDDRLVPLLSRQIKDWADASRGKLAEYAVQALALLGTDPALLAVDAMAIRYRSKNKNIGKAAAEAFAAAAAARGLTTEELGDVVVPWLGFEPGQPRVVDTGKAKVEVRLTDDFKLAYRDLATNKKLPKLPDSAPAALKTEFKDLAASLKEATKSQLLRMETLMVRQFRWSTKRWRELYLQHPLLLPFAQRLVWGLYDSQGKLLATFRALEDRSLTDAADATVTLPEQGCVGIVHPLELAAEARQAWLKHLADYDVVPPFAQLERPVVTVTPEQINTRFGSEVEKVELNAMTFKGRAERLGWARGSVCDAGMVNHYVKTFPTAGVDVFVGMEGMFVGISMDESITLEKIFFVKHGSVQLGSYVYDEPGDEKDARLVPFGAVPPIAFSEAMGDLQKIAGKKDAEPAAEV